MGAFIRNWAKIGALGFTLVQANAIVALMTPTRMALAAETPDELAKRSFEEGIVLEKKGDYPAALAKFRDSAKIKPTPGNRFHIAFCLEMTGKHAAALAEYEAVDKLAREQSKPEVIEQTRGRADPLRGKVPQLVIKLADPIPKDVVVELDGVAITNDVKETKTIRADVGEHVITAHAPDYDPYKNQVTLAESSTTPLEIVLYRAPPPQRAGSNAPRSDRFVEPPVEERKSPPRTGAIVTTGLAVLLIGGGVVSYFIADSTAEDAKTSCPRQLSCNDERNKIRFFDALALGGVAAGLTAGVISIVLWTQKAPQASGTAKLKAGPSWIGVEGRF